ncbi:MAG TPA: hypothetical protein VGZ73_23040 [Bryobacteraceae bacterium]|jgi:hypothetical protein|nr:hypothetical protein [Bryobacteraceae bacterium]
MDVRGALRIDPGCLDTHGVGEDLEIVVPYTEWSLTQAVLERTDGLTAGLNAKVMLVAIHTVPYPAVFECQAAVHTYLVEQLVELASQCPLSVEPQVVLARSRVDGFRHVLSDRSLVLVGTRKRWWRTREEILARALARDGYNVALLHIA